MERYCKLCLNVPKVRKEMRTNHLTMGALGARIGLKDPHTISYYFKNPDKVRLNHITAIAEALGVPPFTYDEFVVRVSSEDEFVDLITRKKPEGW